MYIGMRESEARQFMQQALRAIGLERGEALTLFGGMHLFGHHRRILLVYHRVAENAALPHGKGSDRVLGDRDFILIDTTASLHGYYSDLTRVCIALHCFMLKVLIDVARLSRCRNR